MKTIVQNYHIDAPIEKVWEALVNAQEISGWGGGPAKMDDKIGTKLVPSTFPGRIASSPDSIILSTVSL